MIQIKYDIDVVKMIKS